MVFQLIYTSTSVHPRGHVSDLDILDTSQSVNRQLGLTGFLLRSPNRFIQILEGPQDSVAHIMSKIRKDDRHTILDELSRDGVPTRAFEEWSMGYAEITTTLSLTLTQTFSSGDQDWSCALTRLREVAANFSKRCNL